MRWGWAGYFGVLGGLGGAAVGLGAAVVSAKVLHMTGKRLFRSDMKAMAEAVSGDIPPGLTDLRQETLQIFDRTRSRMRDRTGPGYLDFPDYAQLARARANVQFIREFI
jgi:hypothetical protein